MIKIMQGELYRVRKNHLFFACLLLSVFFIFALSLTFNYNTIRLPIQAGNSVVVSITRFTEFFFSDYSLIIPLTVFLIFYFTEDYQKGIHGILLSKGILRRDFFFGKLIASWFITLFYLVFNFLIAYVFIFFMCAKQPYIECSFTHISGYLVLQILCFIGYSSFLWLLSCLLPFPGIALIICFVLLITLYLYLNKISAALDLSYSLYHYWIVGLSHGMSIDFYVKQLSVIIPTILGYILLSVFLAFLIYRKKDLRR